jgi:hypothetical protein
VKIVTDPHKWSSKGAVLVPGKSARAVASPHYSLLGKGLPSARDLQAANNAL